MKDMQLPDRQTSRYFDNEATGWSARYGESRHFRKRLEIVRAWLEPALAERSPDPGNRPLVLDYGCGSGVILEMARSQGCQVHGVDISPGMLAAARSALAAESDSESVVLELAGDRYTGSFQARRFDGVLCLGVLEYLDAPDMLLERLAGVVKPGGFLILSYPNRRSVLRLTEGWVHRHPNWWRRWGLFAHLTGPDSYLRYQRHQFVPAQFNARLESLGLRLQRQQRHVAPAVLGRLETLGPVGMTVVAEFTKI